jgi:hypothetical protein
MISQGSPHFPHRRNLNGSYDSICTVCHGTVATSRNENELSWHEQNHACSPIRLYELSQYRLDSGRAEFRRQGSVRPIA